MSGPRVICIIPARYASTRLPAKMLIRVGNLPLVMWTYNRAVGARVFDTVCVATDDRRIYDAVSGHGGRAIMTSSDHPSGTDRIREAARHCEGEFIVNLQGDEPLIPFGVLRDVASETLTLDENSLLTCVSNATIDEMHDPNVVKAVLSVNGDALYFSRSAIPYGGRCRETRGLRHCGIYGFSRKSLDRFCSLPRGRLEAVEMLEQLRAVEHGMRVRCLVRERTGRGIDTEGDLEAFRRVAEETDIRGEDAQ